VHEALINPLIQRVTCGPLNNPPPCPGKLTCPTFSERRALAFVQSRIAAGAAWAACFARCVSHLGLEGDLSLAAMKRDACRIWNVGGGVGGLVLWVSCA